jgi:glycosyltransferase involved in cell wall biosynthesis
MSWNPLTYIQQKINKPLDRRIRHLTEDLENIRCRIDLDEALVDRYLIERDSDSYQAAFISREPLVSICIATYNRGELLTTRTLPSLMRQTYTNIEIIVVGDCCSDDTAELISHLNDSRIHFINLSERGTYPNDPLFRWMVAGTTPMNHALMVAQGDFITHLDDDDEHAPTRVEKLLRLAQQEQAELIWHPFDYENAQHKWLRKDALTYASGNITTSSVFYHRWFKQIGWDINAWRMREPGDWNRFRKFRYLGAKHVRHPDSLLKHYREKQQRS